MDATIADTSMVAATSATITYNHLDSDGERFTGTDPGTVTATGTSSDGTDLGTLTVAGTGTDARTITLTATHTATVDRITVVWSVDAVATRTTVIDVVGAQLITFAEFQARQAKSAGANLSDFKTWRTVAHREMLRMCGRSFVPRFTVERVQPVTSDVLLTYPNIRSVRWVRTVNSDGTTTDLDATVASSVSATTGAVAQFASCPGSDVEIGYEHGYSQAPEDVKTATARLIRSLIGAGSNSIEDRTFSYLDAEGGSTRLLVPGLGNTLTGLASVDEVINAYRWHRFGVS